MYFARFEPRHWRERSGEATNCAVMPEVRRDRVAFKDTVMHLYRWLRLDSYRRIFGSVRERSGSLSATEAFSADVIHLLGTPTLSQFAECIGISQPNATYKVNSLVQKGYVRKCVSESDRREVRLETAEKYDRYFQRDSEALQRAITALRAEYSEQEIAAAGKVINSLLRHMEEEEQNIDRPV